MPVTGHGDRSIDVQGGNMPSYLLVIYFNLGIFSVLHSAGGRSKAVMGQTMSSRHLTEHGKCSQGEVFSHMPLNLIENLLTVGEPVNVKCKF